MAGYGAVDTEHEAVVAKDLEIVSRPVARQEAFVVEHRLALIGHHREMAAEAAARGDELLAPMQGMRELRQACRQRC